MIDPRDSHVTPIIPHGNRAAERRCQDALAHLRVIWRHLEDAHKEEEFREWLMALARDLKKALGGREDGLDK